MTEWTYSDIWQAIARSRPLAPAFIQGERVVDWQAFNADADAIAQYLLNAGLGQQSKVGAYFYNCPEYICTVAAALKVGLTPFNVNYRYGGEELVYLLDNADVGVRSCIPGDGDSDSSTLAEDQVLDRPRRRAYRAAGVGSLI
jgi:acyl-CoA synthetase (AMP-forming)/AMP-acid ligase II